MDLKSGACRLQKLAVSVSERADEWWIWWLPVRDIGGKPYTSFGVDITLDRDRCAASTSS